MALKEDEVRKLAASCDCRLVELGGSGIPITFIKSNATIQVYPNSGMVAVCVNLANRGKVQRTLTATYEIIEVKSILERPTNFASGPEAHFRQRLDEFWTTTEDIVGDWDSARRWRYVLPASGLTTDLEEIDLVGNFCTLWDELMWQPNREPIVRQHSNFACGSHQALLEILHEESGLYCGFVNRHRYAEYVEGRSETLEVSTPGDCCNTDEFLKEHWDYVMLLRKAFSKMRRPIQQQLMAWFVTRSFENGRWIDEQEKILELSPIVEQAHRNYGSLFYPKNREDICLVRGVVRDDEDEDDAENKDLRIGLI